MILLLPTEQAKYLEDCIKRAFQEKAWREDKTAEDSFFQ